jgi:hypothetical protein
LKEAGIVGLKPISPFKVKANYLMTDSALAFHWPSLLELNDDIAPLSWLSEEERRLYLSGDTVTTLPIMYTGPPLASPSYSLPVIPNSTPLFAQSFKVLTAFSLFCTASIRMKPAKGVWYKCVRAINVFIPIMPAGWTLPSGILHLLP